jgi:hypothetical protein
MKYINKEIYRSFTECPKKMFFLMNNKEKAKELATIMAETNTEKAFKEAKKMFPAGKNVVGESIEERLRSTKELIQEGYETLFKALFLIEEKYLIEIDIFNKKEDKVWEIIAVKHTSSGEILDFVNDNKKPASIKSQMNELAFQSVLMRRLNLEIIPCSININMRYKRMGDLNIHKLFFKSTLEKPIKFFEEDVEKNLEKIIKINEEPEMTVGSHCKNPSPCVFKKYCWDVLGKDSIHNIPRISQSTKKIDLFLKNEINNVTDFKDKPEFLQELSDDQRKSVNSYLRGKVKKDPMQLSIFLRRIQFPIYYMDFETFSPIIPLYENSRPDAYIPYQYSLHIEEKKDELKHIEFLNKNNEDPRKKFIDSLIPNLGEKGSIIVYNRAFEERILDELVELYPEYTEQVRKIKNRIVDIFSPFKNGHYYHPDMIFSNSLKAVLPALVPNLNYHGMDVSDGEQAMFMYEKMISLPEGEEKEKIVKALLAYCGLDTIAMYEILKVLKK